MSLNFILDRLHTLQPDASIFPPAEGMLREWFNPAVAELFLAHAIEMPQDQMKAVRIEGVGPERCHESALTYCTEHPHLTPWFGFCWLPMDGKWTAWLHSRSTDQALTTRYETDPTASLSTRMVAMWWSRDLYLVLSKRPGAVIPDPLPVVFSRRAEDQPRTAAGRRWIEGDRYSAHS